MTEIRPPAGKDPGPLLALEAVRVTEAAAIAAFAQSGEAMNTMPTSCVGHCRRLDRQRRALSAAPELGPRELRVHAAAEAAVGRRDYVLPPTMLA